MSKAEKNVIQNYENEGVKIREAETSLGWKPVYLKRQSLSFNELSPISP